MLDLKGVNASYGTIQALKNVSLKVGAGDIVSIIGANGAGKTTLLKAISGVLPSKSGAIWYQGTNISPLSGGKNRFYGNFSGSRGPAVVRPFDRVGQSASGGLSVS